MDTNILVDTLINMSNGDLDEAEIRLMVIEEQQRQEKYVRYWQPHPEQQKFWEQLTPEQDTWLVLGGNSSGKTDFAEWLVAVWLLGKDYFIGADNQKWVDRLPLPRLPVSVRGVGLTSSEIRDPMMEKLMGATEHPPFIPPSMIHNYNRQEASILLTNKSKFHGKSADVDPKTHGGPSLDLVHIDEECGYPIFKENQRRIRKRGGKMLVSATPLDDVGTTSHPWIFDLIEQWKDGDTTIGVIFMALEKNPHLEPEFIRREKHRLKGLPDEDARLYGIPVRRSGLFYPMWKPQPPLWVPPYDLPKEVRRIVVIDPASTGPAAAVWMAFDKRGKQIIYRTYKDKGKTASGHVEEILTQNRGESIDLWLMDPFRGRQRQEGDLKTVLQIWRDAGIPRLRLAEVDYDFCLEESREYMNAAFDPSHPHPPMEVFDTCTEFRTEIEKYIVDAVTQGTRKGEVKDKPRKGNDDVMNAWQYGCGMRYRYRDTSPIQLVEAAHRTSF